MAGLIPDRFDSQTPGDISNAAGTAQPWSSGDSVIPFPKPKQTTITIDGDKVTVIDGADVQPRKTSSKFDDNIAELLSEGDLSTIANELLEGIDSDIRSRQEFVDNYTKGLDYLGLKMQTQSVARGRRSTAKVYHPALQWACVRFQAGARGELLPAAGPAKVQLSGPSTQEEEAKARDLEIDLNYYLTTAAPEFYPDNVRGFFYLAYGGNLYKKIYRCPLRQRPVSECVYLKDLIVSNEATDLLSAERVTHEIDMLDRDVRQLMSLGIYRDVPLSQATASDNKIKKKEKSISGQRETPDLPRDTPRTTFETYCFMDLSRFNFKEKGQPKAEFGNGFGPEEVGIPLPYRVTLDRDGRTVLEIRRNWKEGDKNFRRRRMFVKYGLIPGMGFLDYGYIHLIGNVVQALTALLRLTLDAGQFSNFPGGVRTKGARTDTNEINPGPGEFAQVDVLGDDIRKAIMPLPYKEPSPILLQLMQYLEDQIQRIAGAVEFQTGEGRTNIPVGTMMSMVEQQAIVMASVHKGMYNSQKDELIAIKELFEEYPEDLVKLAGVSGRDWTDGSLDDMKIEPRSDPNIPSQIHRIMQAAFLDQLALAHPGKFNEDAVLARILASNNIPDQNLLIPTAQQPAAPPDPKLAAVQAKTQLAAAEMQQTAQTAAQTHAFKMQELQMDAQNQAQDRQSEEKIAMIRLAGERMKITAAEANRGGLTPGAGPTDGGLNAQS